MKKKILEAMIVAASLGALASGTAHGAVIDLTSLGTSGTVNGGTYSQVTVQPAGTGVMDTFVKFNSNNNVVEAFNTTGSGFDNGNEAPHNHEITVGTIGFIDTNGATPGGEVMRFLLDINQSQNGNAQLLDAAKLHLDDVQIFLSSTPNQSLTNGDRPGQGVLVNFANAFLIHHLDLGGDNTVVLNSAITPGSGRADMFLDIPLSSFSAAFASPQFDTAEEQNGAYIYLYSRFGSDPYPNTGGFEEWAYVAGSPINGGCIPTPQQPCDENEVPEPGSLALIGIGLLGARAMVGRRRKQQAV